MKKYLTVALAVLFAVSLTGCGYLVAGGVGAAGGYVLRDKGYKVQSPVKKQGKAETKDKQQTAPEDKTSGDKTSI